MHQPIANYVTACLLALTLMCLPELASAQDPCAPPDIQTDVRPEPHDGPTKVSVGAYVIDLREINDVDQTISLDVAIRMKWTDPRLADLAGCKLLTSDVWYPMLALRNSGRIFLRWPETVSVEEGGQVSYTQRGAGTFSSFHSLERFPFDTQEITLRFFPLDWSKPKVELVADPELSGLSDVLNISDWEILGLKTEVGEAGGVGTLKTHSIFDVTVSAKRYSSFYVLKILLPISLIVTMSWMVFWIDPREFGTQLGLSATAVLTMIAFIFATTNMLPRLGYFTFLDKFIAWATVFVFAALLQSLITGFVASRGQVKAALRIDIISRVLFPLTFGLLCLRYFGTVA